MIHIRFRITNILVFSELDCVLIIPDQLLAGLSTKDVGKIDIYPQD